MLVLVLMLGYDDGAVMGLVLGVEVICYADNDGAGITTIKKRFYFINKSQNFLEGLVI